MSKTSEILIMLLDLNSKGIIRYKSQSNERESISIEDVIEILTYQLNIFIMQNKKNRVYLLIYDEKSTNLIFPQDQNDKLLLETLDLDSIKKSIFQKISANLLSKEPLNSTESVIIEAVYKSIASCLKSNKHVREKKSPKFQKPSQANFYSSKHKNRRKKMCHFNETCKMCPTFSFLTRK